MLGNGWLATAGDGAFSRSQFLVTFLSLGLSDGRRSASVLSYALKDLIAECCKPGAQALGSGVASEGARLELGSNQHNVWLIVTSARFFDTGEK
jgi:hypothetical protein